MKGVPREDEVGQAIIDSITHDLATDTGKLRLKYLLTKLTDAGIDTPPLTTLGSLSHATARTGTAPSLSARRTPSSPTAVKLLLGLTSPISHLYATSLKKTTVHIKPDPINPLFLCVNRIPKPSREEDEIAPKKPIPHTTAVTNHTDMAS
jgi:hypothetical protein